MESLKLFGFFYKVHVSNDVNRIGSIDVVATDAIQVIGCGYEFLFDMYDDDIRVESVQVVPCTKIGNLRNRTVLVAPNDYSQEDVDMFLGKKQLLIKNDSGGCAIITCSRNI